MIDILFVSLRLDIGGTEKHLVRLLPELRQHGIAPSLFVLERGGPLEAVLAAQDVPVFGPAPRSGRRLARLHAAWRLFRHLRRQRPAAVHFFLTEPYLIGSLVAMAAGARTRLMSRRSLAHYQRRYPRAARLEHWLHRRTRVLLGNSQAVVEELIRECGEPGKVGLIANGVDVPPPTDGTARAQARLALGLPPQGLVMTMVANLIAYKGHADLLAALALAKDRLPPDWRLLAVGRDGGEAHTLAGQAETLGLAGHVVWAGAQSDVAPFLVAADMALLTSHEEGFSNSLLEAMAQGLAVVATAVGGNRDAIRHGETGLLVPPKAPPALAAAIVELAAAPARRARLGEAARQDVERRFSVAACTARYARLYRGLARIASVPVQSIIDPD